MNEIHEIEINSFQKNSNGFLVTSLNEFLERYSKVLLNSHRLGYYQMIFISDGSGNIWIDSNKYSLTRGNIFSLSKGQVELLEANSSLSGFVVLFSEEFINKNPGDIGWINNLKLFDSLSVSIVIDLCKEEYEEFVVLLEKIGFEFKSENDFAKDEILMNLLKALLLKSERIKREKIKNLTGDPGDLNYLTQFKNKLEENFSCSRSVQYYANQLNITSKKLNQITSDFWGRPTKQIIEERVLLETKRLLVHTDLTVKEIGSSVGFNDPTNFNKFFKRYIKTTPAEFRLLSNKTQSDHKTASINHL
jgi:AraC family transcriptional regulator, transcriptional activator of pobA